jgi:hypothetical protein
MPFRPRLLRLGKPPAVTQQEFGQAVARAQQIGADVFATPQQIARGFFLLGGNVNRRQGAGTVENRELPRITPIRLDAIPWASRNQARRDNVARHLAGGQPALQFETTGTGFVATPDGTLASEAAHEPPDRGEIRRQRMQRRRLLPRQQHGSNH